MSDSVVYILIDLSVAFILFLIGLGIYGSKGKGVKFLTGYNMRADEERKSKETEIIMCRVYGKRIMFMSVPFVFGAFIDYFKPGIGSAFAWIIYFILLILLLIKRYQMEKKEDEHETR